MAKIIRREKAFRVNGYRTFEVQAPVIECEVCKKEVLCSGFTNTYECGADYNFSGQRLAP